MSDPEPILTINTPRMIHDTIDKETVVIDSESGVYFVVSGSGYLVVQMLEAGASLETLTGRLAAVFDMDAATLRPVIDEFVAQLQAEAIVVPVDVAGSSELDLHVGDEPFRPPMLEKFTDMSELLLIDPIHEVEDRGWPYRDEK